MRTILVVCITLMLSEISAQPSIPTLHKQGTSSQLIVSGKPFLILGGELGNSSASSLDYMRPIWKKLKLMHCNTVLAPIYWELLEPEKGHFDFTLVDSLIANAHKYEMKLVFLWFGSWKNSMSCYVPAWVKKDFKNFPRACDVNGVPQEILTPFNGNNLQADISAFKALLTRIKEKDKDQTVVMIQVENEIGMLPSARDHHPDATKAFGQEVPTKLIQYLQQNKNSLAPSLADAWKKEGYKTKGNWEQVFGKGLATDEMFIAWHFAVFTNAVTEEGKKIYPLPMFVNAALNRPNAKPGDYPSGGPLPHMIDIWKAAAPSIDFLSPDFYNPNFKYWNDLYTRKDNPLFIPEIHFEPSDAAKVFYAVGHYHAMGFSPFSIESSVEPEKEPLGKSYDVLAQLASLIGTHQGKNTMNGMLIDKNLTDMLTFGEYTFTVKHEYTNPWSPGSKEEIWPQTGGLIIQTAAEEFFIAGTGIVVTFSARDQSKGRVGILTIEEGGFKNEKWIPGRVMNGDQSHQGRHLRFEVGTTGIQRLKLYMYK